MRGESEGKIVCELQSPGLEGAYVGVCGWV